MCTNFDVKSGLRPVFTSKLVHELAFGTPKFYIVPYDKIKHQLVNLSSNCDVKSGLRFQCEAPVWQHTFVSPSAFSRRAVVNYWRKYVHEVLVNRLGGLSLPRKSVVRLTDRPDIT